MAKRYGLTMTYPPTICPLASKASREVAVAGWKQIPEAFKKHSVKVVNFDHFDSEHLVIATVDAESTEVVRDFALKIGLMAWNNLKINPLIPMADLIDNIDQALLTVF